MNNIQEVHLYLNLISADIDGLLMETEEWQTPRNNNDTESQKYIIITNQIEKCIKHMYKLFFKIKNKQINQDKDLFLFDIKYLQKHVNLIMNKYANDDTYMKFQDDFINCFNDLAASIDNLKNKKD